MKITLEQQPAGVDLPLTHDREPNSRLDAWIALLGLMAFLMAYTVRELLTRMDAAAIVTNLA